MCIQRSWCWGVEHIKSSPFLLYVLRIHCLFISCYTERVENKKFKQEAWPFLLLEIKRLHTLGGNSSCMQSSVYFWHSNECVLWMDAISLSVVNKGQVVYFHQWECAKIQQWQDWGFFYITIFYIDCACGRYAIIFTVGGLPTFFWGCERPLESLERSVKLTLTFSP